MKKLKKLIAAVSFMVSILEGSSQEIKAPKNSLYLEVFGSGGLFSINYERRINSNLYGRLGVANWTFAYETETTLTTIPVMITYLWGEDKNHFETAGGMLFGRKTEDDINHQILDLIAFIGYRYQPPDNGLVFRVGFTPFFSLDNDANYPANIFFASAGISIGYHF